LLTSFTRREQRLRDSLERLRGTGGRRCLTRPIWPRIKLRSARGGT
jgi:hypothetical protein